MVVFGTDVCFVGVLGESAFGVNGVAFGFSVSCLAVWRMVLILVSSTNFLNLGIKNLSC